MPENVYGKLRALLDRFPFGCPPAFEIIEILKILFTEDEARVALGLGFMPFTVQEIADRAGVDPQEAKQRLESLADKGIVFAREEDGVWGYALENIYFLFEHPYKKGVHDETINKLTPLWKKYLPVISTSWDITTPIFRIIPIQEEVEHIGEVLPYEKIYEMIDEAEVMGIFHCACRELEENCDAPREACMFFGETCTFLVKRGFGRYLTKEEMKQKLREFDEAGLLHQVINTQNGIAICNCCPCCCLFLRTMTEFGNPHIMIRSAFLPVNDSEQCVGCGICADKRCPMKAIEMVDEKPVVKVERCIGCGLCSSGCPNDAMHLEKSIEVPKPAADASELGLRVLEERGKLEEFMEVMTL